MKCQFVSLSESRVRCQRCGRKVKTPYAAEPERVHAKCGGVWIGFGDVIAWLTDRLGFKQRKGCGCKRRQRTLNRWLPFPRIVRAWLMWMKLWRTSQAPTKSGLSAPPSELLGPLT